MTELHDINNVVARLAQEHHIITDYVVKFNKKINERDERFVEELHDFLSFLKKDLIRHFQMEELIFFPAAAVGAPDYDTLLMVMSLQKDHGALEIRLKRIIAATDARAVSGLDSPMLKKLSLFFDDLKDHARRELTELFPLINENPRCKELMKTYITQVKSDVN